MGWEHYQTVDPLQKEPQVRRGLFGQPRSQDLYPGLGVKVLRTRLLFGVRLLILHFKFQFSKSIKSSTFHVFLNLLSFKKKISLSQNAQKSLKNLRKTAKHW